MCENLFWSTQRILVPGERLNQKKLYTTLDFLLKSNLTKETKRWNYVYICLFIWRGLDVM